MSATITPQDVEYIAQLARLHLSAAERQRTQQDLSNILHYFETLNRLATDDVEPLAHPGEVHSVLRDDVARESYAPAQSLQNSPASEGTFFAVPKVLDQDSGDP